MNGNSKRYPGMMRIRQRFQVPGVADLKSAIHGEVLSMDLSEKVQRGQSVAIPVGSRGVGNIASIIKTLVDELKGYGLKPFIVPAMGSHGGGTAEGQREIIESYGVTEGFVGAPIRSSMEVVEVGKTEDGVPVYFDRHANEADHTIVVNRIKPHPEFFGPTESGLLKMLLIGLGKHRGAQAYHRVITHYGFEHLIRTGNQVVLEACNVLFGLAIVENQRHETALIEAIEPGRLFEREPELLKKAKECMARIPFEDADLLIVDEIGKNICGSGLDTNVVGRKRYLHVASEHESPKIRRIFVRDLTDETHGNAIGIGIAEFALSRAVDKMDRRATYINCITADGPAAASIPVHFDTDREVLDAALTTIGRSDPEQARVIRIRNTLELEQILVSEAYREEVEKNPDLSFLGESGELELSSEGFLLPFNRR